MSASTRGCISPEYIEVVLRQLAVTAARHVPDPIRRWVHRNPALYTLARKTFATALSADNGTVEISEGPMKGLRLAVSPHISHAHVTGASERVTVDALSRLVRPGYVCYDLGASIGYMALLMARTAAQVYAFEPAPHAAAEIHRNAAANGFTNITVVPVPVSDTVREVEFALTDVAYGSAIAHGESRWPTLKLTTTTLDDFIRDHPVPDLIKIDVEDEEGRVMLGARNLLRLRKSVICCELHSHESADTVLGLLREDGYSMMNITGAALQLPERIIGGDVQIIAVPPTPAGV